MKRLIIHICLLVVVAFSMQIKAAQVLDTSSVSSPKILIISSYRAEADWSKRLIDGLVADLNQQYPNVYIHVGYMNLEVDAPTVALFTLRSILWSFADYASSTSTSAEDSRVNSIFSSEKRPDVLIFIGNDALLFYQSYGPWLEKWRSVPIVVCGAAEQLVTENWNPLKGIKFDSLAPVEERREVDVFVLEKIKNTVEQGLPSRPETYDGHPGNTFQVPFNLTGVKSVLPIRENLELIHSLVTDLEEIVWVDSDFYTADYAQWLVGKELAANYPNIKFSQISQNRFNTDSIYNEILKPVSHKAYLTYSWDVLGMYSRQSDEQIKTLFSNYSTVPLFSLTHRSLNPYWVGGYYRPCREYVDKTIKQVNRILAGEPVNSIPFETITDGQIVLDQPILERYGLWDNAKSLSDVRYVNVPPTFYEENEKFIFAGIIVGTILLGLVFYWLARIRHRRKAHKEYVRYKRLYNKLHLIYGHTSIDLALYDKKGDLIFCITNGREYTLGYEKNGLFSDNIFENQNLNRSLREQIQNNQSINSEVTLYPEGQLSSVDSERRVYQLMVKPLSSDNSQSARYVAIAISLNQMIREREERERFESLVRFASDSSQVGIAFYNIDTSLGTATNSWYYNLNEPLTPGLYPTYSNIVAEDREQLIAYREAVRRGESLEPFNQDIRVLDEKGKEHWIAQHIFVNEDDPRMLIELNLNVDEQKINENNLLQAKRKVERSIVETQEFLANINHEIRTPLNSIVGFSAILAASESEEERKEHVSLILKNNKLLTMLIDDVIELSKIDSSQIDFRGEPVQMAELFNRVTEVGYSELYNRQLDIVLELDEKHPVVYTDPDAIYRLLINLLSNAIKFTEEGRVTLGYRREADRYYFFVEDTGKGIAPEDIQRIFKRFVKLDLYMQGTGLGLALCKSIVDRLGGEMGVESEVGKGSTFWFALPLQ